MYLVICKDLHNAMTIIEYMFLHLVINKDLYDALAVLE